MNGSTKMWWALAALLAVAGRAQAGPPPGKAPHGLLVMSSPIVLAHARAFPRAWRGRSYVVIVATNEAVADEQLAVPEDDREVVLPGAVCGVSLWINTSTRQLDEAGFTDEETFYNGGYLPDKVDLEFTSLDDSHVAGRISVPPGSTLDGKPMSLALDVDLPVRPLRAQGATGPKPPAAPPAGPAPGTVTGSLLLDGKPIVVRNATAISVPSPIVRGENAYIVALSSTPVSVDPRPADTLADRFDRAFEAGASLRISVFTNGSLDCMLLIRDPSLGDRRVLKLGACPAGAVTVGPGRVHGTVVSSTDGKEETLSGHKVSYTLRFDAPVVK